MASPQPDTLNGSGPLLYKPDWPRAQKRWTAFWNRQNNDRPLMDVRAPSGKSLPPFPPPPTLEAKYFDPDYIEAAWLRTMEATYFGGESVPSGGFLLAGYALGCGEGVGFADNTVWHPHLMDSMDQPVPWQPGPDDPWRHRLDRVVNRLLAASKGKFLVGATGQVPLNDLIALLRGTEDFLLDLATEPDLCAKRMAELFDRFVENAEHYIGLVSASQHGRTFGYPGLWSDEPFKAMQSDMSCMISPAMFAKWVMPELDMLGERYAYLWYHLDGPGAVVHLPALLGRPYIRCIQYVPGSGAEPNGPHWINLYRQVQAAGRCLEIAVPPEHVEYVIRRLRPEGLLVRTRAASAAEADELLDKAAEWAGSDAGRA